MAPPPKISVENKASNNKATPSKNSGKPSGKTITLDKLQNQLVQIRKEHKKDKETAAEETKLLRTRINELEHENNSLKDHLSEELSFVKSHLGVLFSTHAFIKGDEDRKKLEDISPLEVVELIKQSGVEAARVILDDRRVWEVPYGRGLPGEVFARIIRYASNDLPTLKALSQVNSPFDSIAAKLLFGTVTMSGGLLKVLDRLKHLDGRPADYVEKIIIRRSMGLVPLFLEEQDLRDWITVPDISVVTHGDLFWVGGEILEKFFIAVRETVTELVIDFADETLPPPPGIMTDTLPPRRSLMTNATQELLTMICSAFRNAHFPCLSTLRTNQLDGLDLQHCFMGPPPLRVFYSPKAKRARSEPESPPPLVPGALDLVEKLQIRFEGMYDGKPSPLYTGKVGTFDFATRKTTGITDLDISFLPLNPIHFYNLEKQLTYIHDRLTSLSLAGVVTYGLKDVVVECTNLTKLSFSHMKADTPEDSWSAIFKACLDLQLQHLHVDTLSGNLPEPCEEIRALAYSDEDDFDGLCKLVGRVVHRRGVVTHSPDRICFREGDNRDPIVSCEHDQRQKSDEGPSSFAGEIKRWRDGIHEQLEIDFMKKRRHRKIRIVTDTPSP